MTHMYEIDLRISRTEDELWRVEVPGLQGCWVDAKTLAQALAEIQDVVVMVADLHLEEGGTLPSSVRLVEGSPAKASLPVLIEEHPFRRVQPKAKTGGRRQ